MMAIEGKDCTAFSSLTTRPSFVSFLRGQPGSALWKNRLQYVFEETVRKGRSCREVASFIGEAASCSLLPVILIKQIFSDLLEWRVGADLHDQCVSAALLLLKADKAYRTKPAQAAFLREAAAQLRERMLTPSISFEPLPPEAVARERTQQSEIDGLIDQIEQLAASLEDSENVKNKKKKRAAIVAAAAAAAVGAAPVRDGSPVAAASAAPSCGGTAAATTDVCEDSVFPCSAEVGSAGAAGEVLHGETGEDDHGKLDEADADERWTGVAGGFTLKEDDKLAVASGPSAFGPKGKDKNKKKRKAAAAAAAAAVAELCATVDSGPCGCNGTLADSDTVLGMTGSAVGFSRSVCDDISTCGITDFETDDLQGCNTEMNNAGITAHLPRPRLRGEPLRADLAADDPPSDTEANAEFDIERQYVFEDAVSMRADAEPFLPTQPPAVDVDWPGQMVPTAIPILDVGRIVADLQALHVEVGRISEALGLRRVGDAASAVSEKDSPGAEPGRADAAGAHNKDDYIEPWPGFRPCRRSSIDKGVPAATAASTPTRSSPPPRVNAVDPGGLVKILPSGIT